MIKEQIGLSGIPFDFKSSHLLGTAAAPNVVRQYLYSGSDNARDGEGLVYWPDWVIDKGNFQIQHYQDIGKLMIDRIDLHKRWILLGGDHSITYQVVKSFSKIYGPINMVQMDAHTDLYDQLGNDLYSHACPFTRLWEEGCLKSHIIIGARSFNKQVKKNIEKYSVKIIHADQVNAFTGINLKGPSYLSMDIDVFDPGFAPGVSHHEPGGVSPAEIIQVMNSINADFVGSDLVEYNPNLDQSGITAALVVKMFKQVCTKMVSGLT